MLEATRPLDLTAPRAMGRAQWVRRLWPLGLVALDASIIYSALGLAYWTRYILKVGPIIRDQVTFGAYQPLAVLLLATMLPVLFLKGAYRLRLSNETADEVIAIFSAATISVATIIVITSMAHKFLYSRGLIVYLWVLVIVLVSAGRILSRAVLSWCYRHGWGTRRLIVVGTSDSAKLVMQSVMNRPDLGYHLEGFVEQNEAVQIRDFGRFHGLGRVADLEELLTSHPADEIIVALPASAHEESLSVLELCEKYNIGLKLVPDLFEMSLSRVRVDDIAGIPLLDVQERRFRRLETGIKRCLDVAVSMAVLALVTPLIALLALLIRLESGSPSLLRQVRVGLDGKPFVCFKLRTMRAGAEHLQHVLAPANQADGPLFKLRNDPRCTRVGRHIRRWSLDELPQLWNVLRGEMSLVGPRPALPHEVAQYQAHQRRRLEAKPGLTGPWQVSGRSDLPFDEMVMMDVNYVENWSLAFDLRIILRTFIAVLTRHGAY